MAGLASGLVPPRLALDQIPNTGKDLKYKIVRNIGNAYVKIGQYQDAIGSYETIMEGGNPDIQTGFNLLLCYYALGDRDKLKRHFTKLLNIRKYGASDDDDLDEVMDEVEKENEMFHVDDHLRAEIRERRKQHMEILLTAARLIAPMIEKDWMEGFNYIIEQLRHYELKDASSRCAAALLCDGREGGGGGWDGAVLREADFFWGGGQGQPFRTALRDHQPPPTANPHQPPTANPHQPPTATNRQLPTATNRQPPTTNSHQPPTATNRQLPTATNHQPPTPTNRQPPPTANRQPLK